MYNWYAAGKNYYDKLIKNWIGTQPFFNDINECYIAISMLLEETIA